MTKIQPVDRIEITQEEAQLIVEALQDAMFYRDARAHVSGRMVRRAQSRGARTAHSGSAGDEHRAKAQSYAALAAGLRLKLARN